MHVARAHAGCGPAATCDPAAARGDDGNKGEKLLRTQQAKDADELSPEHAAKRRDGGMADQFRLFQQSIGNTAVSQLVATLPDRPATTFGAVKADDEPGPEPAATEAVGAPTSGTIPDKEPEEVTAHEKGAGEFKEDASGPAGQGRRGESAGPSGATKGGTLRLEPGAVNVDVTTPEVEGETGRSRDTVAVGTVTNAFSNPDTSPSSSAFGSESFKAGYKNAAFTTAGTTVSVNFTLDINCPWGTKSGGKKDVGSGTDPLVTKDSYPTIVSDLTPVLKEKSWRAPRSQYWSEAICKRHERFHSTDDKAWSEGAGKQVVTSYLAGKTVNQATAEADVNTHLAAAVAAMDTANFQFYTGGAASYLSYSGEERAFGDGKQPYLDLAAAVKAQGEALKAAATPAAATPPAATTP